MVASYQRLARFQREAEVLASVVKDQPDSAKRRRSFTVC